MHSKYGYFTFSMIMKKILWIDKSAENVEKHT